MKNIELLYPGYTKKAITFSIDDGHVQYDKKLLDILRPAGIKGTFNLTSADRLAPQEYRELYCGYEIANHCKHHPYAICDGKSYAFSDDPFDPATADTGYLYKHPSIEGLYYVSRPRGWRLITDPKTYIEFIGSAERELEAVFGEGSIKSFAWPFSEQGSEQIKEYLSSCGYYAVRQSGLVLDTTRFAFPESAMGWRCNANHANLLDVMAIYENYPDDGELKFFCFGVHSADFEHSEKWEDLKAFADKYGNRPDDFYYATVGEIFAYHKALNMLCIDGKILHNPTDTEIFVRLDGEGRTLLPHTSLSVE